jgi:hypothetical protein
MADSDKLPKDLSNEKPVAIEPLGLRPHIPDILDTYITSASARNVELDPQVSLSPDAIMSSDVDNLLATAYDHKAWGDLLADIAQRHDDKLVTDTGYKSVLERAKRWLKDNEKMIPADEFKGLEFRVSDKLKEMTSHPSARSRRGGKTTGTSLVIGRPAGVGLTGRGALTARGGSVLALAAPAIALMAPLIKEGIKWLTNKLQKRGIPKGSGVDRKEVIATINKLLARRLAKNPRSSIWRHVYDGSREALRAQVGGSGPSNALVDKFLSKHAKRLFGVSRSGITKGSREKAEKVGPGYYHTLASVIHPLIKEYGVSRGALRGLSMPIPQASGGALMDEIIGAISDPKIHAMIGETAKKYLPMAIDKLSKFATGKILDWWHKRRERKAKANVTPATPTEVATETTPSTTTPTTTTPTTLPTTTTPTSAAAEGLGSSQPLLVPAVETTKGYGLEWEDSGYYAHGGSFGSTADQHEYSGLNASAIYTLAKKTPSRR